jgi:8-oxo-dGTP diphosphatase
MPNGRDTDLVRAAGAVVWRPGTRGAEIALVHRPRYDDWSYPKGKCERDEHVLLAAVREVEEETGLRIVLGRQLSPVLYRSGGRPKRVDYWIARCVGSAGFVPGNEVDEVAWLPVAQARKRLSYERDLVLLEEFSAGPVRTSPVILLRHATAGRKRAAPGTDLERPLDAQGISDAKQLVGLLGCFAPVRVVSSPAERCVATVRPFAAAAGIAVELEPAFAAGSVLPGISADQGKELSANRAASLAGSGIASVACAHRENLPRMLEAACAALGASPPRAAALPKGGFWVLQSAGGKLVGAEQHWLAE